MLSAVLHNEGSRSVTAAALPPGLSGSKAVQQAPLRKARRDMALLASSQS